MPDDFDDIPEIAGANEPKKFLNAVDAMLAFLKEKVAMTADEFNALSDDAKVRATTVSGVADLDIVSSVWNAVDQAVKNGETLEDFKERVTQNLESEWGGENPSRVETIFRTNVQSAYSAGRFEMNNHPSVKKTHPYVRYSVVMDDRTSSICEPLDGLIMKSDDPFVLSHQPPLHFNCRTDVVAITAEEAGEDVEDTPPPGMEKQEGFGNPLKPFEPDLSSRPSELTTIYKMKVDE